MDELIIEALEAEIDRLREALEAIAEQTERRQLPLTALINDMAKEALIRYHELPPPLGKRSQAGGSN